MTVCVVGLWHLGVVTAAGLASRGVAVVGLDADAAVVEALRGGTPPVSEPGLAEQIQQASVAGRLRFSSDVGEAVGGADVVWITYDTPVDDDDRADVAYVVERVQQAFPYLRDGATVLVSSQVPVGTTAAIETAYRAWPGARRVGFAYSPENLRLGTSLDAFLSPDRIVVGVRDAESRAALEPVLASIGGPVEWMSVESAEVTKHALNGFLATSISFANEVAAVCERVGADAADVARALKSERRIGRHAYLAPGPAFAGGTLARDIQFLTDLGVRHGLPLRLVPAVKQSNDVHRGWSRRALQHALGDLRGRTVAVLGLTYKPGTDTLRRSSAVELCEWMHEAGASVRAFDPVLARLPDTLGYIELAADVPTALDGADAVAITTPWPQFGALSLDVLVQRMRRPLVLDPHRVLIAGAADRRLEYVTVGRVTT